MEVALDLMWPTDTKQRCRAASLGSLDVAGWIWGDRLHVMPIMWGIHFERQIVGACVVSEWKMCKRSKIDFGQKLERHWKFWLDFWVSLKVKEGRLSRKKKREKGAGELMQSRGQIATPRLRQDEL